VAWPLELHLPCRLVFAQPFEARVAEEVVGGPGGEGHFRHQARVNPAGAALVGARDRGEGRGVALDLSISALGSLAEYPPEI